MRKTFIAALAFLALASTAYAEPGVTAYVGSSTVTGSQAGTDTIPVANDVSGYGVATIQFTSVGSGNTVTFEGSNDNLTWFTTSGTTLAGATHTGAVSPSTSTGYLVSLGMKFWRMRVSTYSSGLVTAVVTYKAGTVSTVNASGSSVIVGGPAVDDAAASGNPVPVGGIYNTTLPTYSNLDRTQLQFGSRGAANVTIMDNGGAAGVSVANASADGITPAGGAISGLATRSAIYSFDGTNFNRNRSIINATDSTGTGIAAAGLVAQCDDTSPTAATENQFGNLRRNCTTGALFAEQIPSASAAPALSTCVILELANTDNETNCASAAANLYGFVATNNSATVMYLTFYNAGSATTCGTSEVQTYMIPIAAAGGNVTVMFPAPVNFTTGLSYCVTTGITGVTAPSASTGNVVVLYK